MIAIATVVVFPAESARSERSPDAHSSSALGASILRSFEFEGRGLAMVSQWTRVLGRVSRRSEAFARCAADETQCTSRGMRYWLQILTAAADLGRKEQLQAVNRFFNRWPYRSDREVYRVGEYWASPAEFMARSGDCDLFIDWYQIATKNDYSVISLRSAGQRTQHFVQQIGRQRSRNSAVIINR